MKREFSNDNDEEDKWWGSFCSKERNESKSKSESFFSTQASSSSQASSLSQSFFSSEASIPTQTCVDKDDIQDD